MTFTDVGGGTGIVSVSVGAPSTVGSRSGTVTIRVYADVARTREIAGSPLTIGVTYVVTAPPIPGSFSVSPTSLSFAANQGDGAPPSQDVTVTTQPGSSGAVYLSVASSGISGATAVLDASVSPPVVHVTMPAPGTSGSGHVYVYAYEDAAHARALPGSPKDVAVTYTVTPSEFAAAPSSLTFTAPSGMTPPAQEVNLSDTALGSAGWTSSVAYVGSSGWLSASPTAGTGLPATATVSVTPPTYPDTYHGQVAFTARGVTRIVPVTLTVTRPRVVGTPDSLAFTSIRGQTTPIASKPLALAADNGASLAYTTSVTYGVGASGWLTLPASGTAPETISVGIGGPPLAVGRYTATVTISGPYGSAPTSVPVTYDVLAPELAVPASQSFFVDQYTAVADTSKPLGLSDAGTPISWTATVDAPWLQVTPSSGTTGTTSAGTALVLSEVETMSQGSHAATIVLTYVATSGATVQVRVPVTLGMYLAYVDLVAPRVWVEGVGGDVLLRGRGFAYPFPIRFGAADATWAYGATSTQVKATPPALVAGSYAVTSRNNLGLARSRAQLDVVAPVTRPAALSVPSAGRKAKALFDDVREALYVANVGLGKVQRHREAAAWVVDPAVDEIALAGLKNIALSPDGKTILAIAGYSLKTIDAATFALTAAQPAATIPSYVSSTAAFDLEYLNDGRAIFVDKPAGSVGDVRIFDPATDAISYPGVILRPPGLAISKDGSRAVIFGAQTSYPPQSVSYYDANASAVTTTTAQQDASFGAVDRHGTRTLLCGVDGGSWKSVLYDASFAVLPGGLPATTAALALSSIGLGRAYTWDGTRVHAFAIEGPVTGGLWDDAYKPGLLPKATPGTNAVLALSADELTAFLAGDSAIQVVPLPP